MRGLALLALAALAACGPLGLAGDAVVGTAQAAVGVVDLAI